MYGDTYYMWFKTLLLVCILAILSAVEKKWNFMAKTGKTLIKQDEW